MVNKITFVTVLLMAAFFNLNAQLLTETSTFEEMDLKVDSFWNGRDSSGGFVSGKGYFLNSYNFTYNFWATGWAVSTMTDTLTPGAGNLYSAITGAGKDSKSYAVGQQNAKVKLLENFNAPRSLWITNTTYAVRSMEQGDQFAKKFGGPDGTDPDYFLLKIYGYRGGELDTSRYVKFYLADFRSDDSSQDYIVKQWTEVDLSVFSNVTVDSLLFVLESSDTSKYGYNTPLFFAIDDLTLGDVVAVKDYPGISWTFYPNPCTDYITVEGGEAAMVELCDLKGEIILRKALKGDKNRIDLRALKNGEYLLNLKSREGKTLGVKKIIKY